MEFVNIRTLAREGTSIVKQVEKSGKSIIITKLGRPVAMLSKATGKERGKKETVSILRNEASRVIAEFEKSGKRLIITRDNVPVAVLIRVSVNAFRIRK